MSYVRSIYVLRLLGYHFCSLTNIQTFTCKSASEMTTFYYKSKNLCLKVEANPDKLEVLYFD